MSKILVTGGAGYLGSHTILEILASKKWDVISADNYSNSSPNTFKRIKNITGKEIRNYEVDLCHKEETIKIFRENKDITGIIHFAAFKSVPESVQNPQLYFSNNMGSLENVLGCAKEFNVPYFIFSSSCSVYGQIDKLPVTETTPLNKAMSPYGETKQKGEIALAEFTSANPHTVKVIALRYFNPAGAHPSGKIGEVPAIRPTNLVPMITGTAIGRYPEMFVHGSDYPTRDGSCIRDYVHVCDIARAHIDALSYLENTPKAPDFSIINLGTGNGLTVLEMIKAFEKVSGKKLNYRLGARREGDVASIYSDSTLARNTIHWQPAYSLDDMMLSAWKWEMNFQKGD
jgi:UDP-glucose 4-epimerase